MARLPRPKRHHSQNVRFLQCHPLTLFSSLVTFLVITHYLSPWLYATTAVRFISSSQPADPLQSTLTLPTEEWQRVILLFLSTVPHAHFRSDLVKAVYKSRRSFTSALLTLKNGQPSVAWPPSNRRYYDKDRLSALEETVRAVSQQPNFPSLNLSVLVDLADGVKRPGVATLANARVWRIWTSAIPVPMGRLHGWDNGTATPVIGWDDYVEKHIINQWEKYPWYLKQTRAVFRGALRVCDFVLGSCNFANGARCRRTTHWDQCARGILFKRVRKHHTLFDVGFTSWAMREGRNFHQMDGAPPAIIPMAFNNFQKFKFIINVGSNNDWAERLRGMMFMNSVILQHMAEYAQFFTPLLKPWHHFIPFSLNMSDLVTNVQFVTANDRYARSIRDSQYAFAKRFLTEKAMLEYWRIVLIEIARRQQEADTDYKEVLRNRTSLRLNQSKFK